MDDHETIRLLAAAGLKPSPTGPHTIATSIGVLRVMRGERRPSPEDVRRKLERTPANERLLVAVESSTPGLLQAAQTNNQVVLAIARDSTLWLDGRELHAGNESKASRPGATRQTRGPVSYGRFAVLRALLIADAPRLQNALAKDTGLSQPAVSNALRSLDGLVQRSAEGWAISDRDAAWDIAISSPDNGITTYWWNDTSLTEQASRLTADETLLSGDLAADRIAGWRIPEHVTIYSRRGIDMSRLGFASASRDNYTAAVTVPADKTIWETARTANRRGIADPIIVARDVLATGTTGDESEAADMIRRSVLKPRTSRA